MNFGWECPKCHKVWAPSVLECGDCNCADHLRALPVTPFDISPHIVPPSFPHQPTSGDPLPLLPTIVCSGIAGDPAIGNGRNSH